MYHDIIIVGAGASGIIAAVAAKDKNLDVGLIEGCDRIGKKILTTGNGRCNITNKNMDSSKFHSSNTNFFSTILNKFKFEDTINFFSSLGLPLIELDEGKMYPMSLQASSVLDILKLALYERDIPVYLNNKIKDIKIENDSFVLFSQTGEIFKCKKLILSCGGCSAPKTGSDGSGFNLAKKLGHEIIDPVPGLVQLKLNHNRLKALSGIKFQGAISAYNNNSFVKEYLGEILFTDYGVSGPPVLQISSLISRDIKKNNSITINLDLMPNMSYHDLKNFLENHWGIFNYRSVLESLIGVINKKLIPIILKEATISDIHKSCIYLTWEEKENLFNLLKQWNFQVCDTNSFSNSQITCGGINTLEVNSNSLESKLVKNLFFTGEILDINGDCGGFNLQWAWSSGYIVGNNL
ncbi:NAD(P)/FAD-dependent oxidoreductase [Clostridium rectalis]|uniref:NAD(P)/FAD-dependent oxidoreductase n=1 Tax=Clostridium rectalis TaxID=2040295 RepID=UPI000F631B2F|nr:NAD(P)/FAD-dependent oxidoreductase [Clostridium rectalis]